MGSADKNDGGSADLHREEYESGSFSMAASSNGTETVTFAESYEAAAGNAGPDVAGSLLGSVSARWKGWTTNSAGEIDGMSIVWDNGDAVSHTCNWSVRGLRA